MVDMKKASQQTLNDLGDIAKGDETPQNKKIIDDLGDIAKGDVQGHPFRGNQYTSGSGGASGTRSNTSSFEDKQPYSDHKASDGKDRWAFMVDPGNGRHTYGEHTTSDSAEEARASIEARLRPGHKIVESDKGMNLSQMGRDLDAAYGVSPETGIRAHGFKHKTDDQIKNHIKSLVSSGHHDKGRVEAGRAILENYDRRSAVRFANRYLVDR